METFTGGGNKRVDDGYPCIDLLDGKVVRLVKGDPGKKTTYSDDPVEGD